MSGDPTTRLVQRCAACAERAAAYGQAGSGEGKVVPALLPDQQLSVPAVSQARSTVNTDGTDGSGFFPFCFAVLPVTRLPSGFGSMSSAVAVGLSRRSSATQ